MTLTVRSLISQLFNRRELNLRKHLTAPREALFDIERQLSRQLKTHFRQQRRSA